MYNFVRIMYHKLTQLYIPVQSRNGNKVPRAASRSPGRVPAAATRLGRAVMGQAVMPPSPGPRRADDMAEDAGEDSESWGVWL